MTQFRRYAKNYVQTLIFGKNLTRATRRKRRPLVPPMYHTFYDSVPRPSISSCDREHKCK